MDPKLKQFGRRLLTGLFLVAFFFWLATRNPSEGRVHATDILALGTLVTLTVWLAPDQPREPLDVLFAEIEQALKNYEHRWSLLSDGELAQLNARLAAGEAVSIPETLRPLLAQAVALGERSGGLFDVRIGALVKLWQFHDQTRYRTEPPAPEALAEALAAFQAAPPLRLDAPYGPAPGVQLDVGGIAKGDAARWIGDRLIEAGYPHYIVNLGGNVEVAGARGERPWRIGIRHPRPADRTQSMLALLPTDGREAVMTSGDYERQFESGGERYHHLLDPRTGTPARGLLSVTVVHPDPLLAEVASTALFVAGPDWPATALALGVDQVLVMTGEGRLIATERLAVPEGRELERLP
jgi:thiamine biosynthesis lipoprotein